MNGWSSPEIERYLAPQERFEALRHRATLRAGRQLCDLAYANSYDGPAPTVTKVIRNCLERDRTLDLQYTPYGGSTTTRRLIARHLTESHGERFNWRDVVLTPGAMAAINALFRLVRRDGQPNEVIVTTPCWLDYPLYLANLGLTPVIVPPANELGRFNLDGVARALGPHTRAVIFSQPNNPLGTLHSREELRDLGVLLAASQARPLLIADECHRDILFEPDRFSSPLEHYDASCVVYSFGKSHFIQGQRIGYAAISPRMAGHLDIAQQLERVCRTMGFCTPTALMQLAVRDLIRLKPDLGQVRRRRHRLRDALQISGYDVVPSHATFFLYARCPDQDDFAFADYLAERSLLVLPSSLFHHKGYFRVSVTASDEMIARAITILKTAGACYPRPLERLAG